MFSVFCFLFSVLYFMFYVYLNVWNVLIRKTMRHFFSYLPAAYFPPIRLLFADYKKKNLRTGNRRKPWSKITPRESDEGKQGTDSGQNSVLAKTTREKTTLNSNFIDWKLLLLLFRSIDTNVIKVLELSLELMLWILNVLCYVN